MCLDTLEMSVEVFYTKVLTNILHQHGTGAASFSDKGQTVNILS